MNDFPREQNEVLFQDRIDVRLRELLADSPAVFVKHHARGLVHDFPSALPRHVPEVRVLQVERMVKRIESAQFQEFSAVKRTRSAASIETRVEIFEIVLHTMPHSKRALLPPSFRQPGFFALL